MKIDKDEKKGQQMDSWWHESREKSRQWDSNDSGMRANKYDGKMEQMRRKGYKDEWGEVAA